MALASAYQLPLFALDKRCRKCGCTKPVTEFRSVPNRRSGLRSTCKQCDRAYAIAYARAHPERCCEWKRAARAADPDKHRRWLRTWIAVHPERVQAYNEQRRAKYGEKERENKRAWYRTHSQTETYRFGRKKQKLLRRAREKSSERSLTQAQWQELLALCRGCCPCCHEPFNDERPPTIDHIVPISKHGPHTRENVQPLCLACNQAKGTRIIDYRP